MSRVLFGSILIPDNADEAYLASLGLSEKDIKEAMQDSPHYDAGYKILDPLKAICEAKKAVETDTSNAAESTVKDNCKNASEENENTSEDAETSDDISEIQYASDDVIYDYGGRIKTWKSVFKPPIRQESAQVLPIKQESDVTEWITFSLTPHTEDEIREKVLTDYHNVCFAYICAHQKLSEEFIIELAALSTGLLHKFNYSENIDYLKYAVMISAGIEEGPYDFGMLPEDQKFTLANVKERTTDRLDWRAIATNQTLSKPFIDKYHSLLFSSAYDVARYMGSVQSSAV